VYISCARMAIQRHSAVPHYCPVVPSGSHQWFPMVLSGLHQRLTAFLHNTSWPYRAVFPSNTQWFPSVIPSGFQWSSAAHIISFITENSVQTVEQQFAETHHQNRIIRLNSISKIVVHRKIAIHRAIVSNQSCRRSSSSISGTIPDASFHPELASTIANIQAAKR
jgi:hypothetical protein